MLEDEWNSSKCLSIGYHHYYYYYYYYYITLHY
jgi:hypothetical protein